MARYQASHKFRKKFGITIEDHDALAALVAGNCWLCRQPQRARKEGTRPNRLAVDHDHTKEQGHVDFIRGLLCTSCNVWLGHWENNTDDWRTKAATYLATPRPDIPEPPSSGRTTPKWIRGFGLTIDQFDTMEAERNSSCDMCGGTETRTQGGKVKKLSVDHDHALSVGDPGYIRGLLCGTCNTRLGWYENTTWQAAMTQYLVHGPALATLVLAKRAQEVARQAEVEAAARRTRLVELADRSAAPTFGRLAS